jgi:hypothetical protein
VAVAVAPAVAVAVAPGVAEAEIIRSCLSLGLSLSLIMFILKKINPCIHSCFDYFSIFIAPNYKHYEAVYSNHRG